MLRRTLQITLAACCILPCAKAARGDVALASLPGGGAVAVWSGAEGIEARLLDTGGQPIGVPASVLRCRPAADRIAAVTTPTGAAVLFGANGRLWVLRLGSQGEPRSDAQRIWESVPRPVTAASVGGRIGMLARREAGPIVATPEQGAIGTLIGTAESPQILLLRYEGLPVVGPVLPPLSGLGEAVMGAREAELATLAASTDGAFLTRIGLDGSAMGNPVRLGAPDVAASQPSLIGTADGWAAAWTEGGAARVALLTASASAPRTADTAGLPSMTSPTLAATSSGLALVGRSGNDLVVARFDSSGRRRGRVASLTSVFPEGTAWFAVSAGGRDGQDLFIAIDGTPPRIITVDARGSATAAQNVQ